MSATFNILAAIGCYFMASVVITFYIRANKSGVHLKIATGLGFIAVAWHLVAANQISHVGNALNLSLNSMVVLISGIVVLTFLLGGLAMPIKRLGILVFPLTAFSLIFALLWGGEPDIAVNQTLAFNAHILISIIAYALLAIAAVQALLYVYQERQIKRRANPAMLMALPPLQTMETLLFRLVSFGFALLSLTLITGVVFTQQIFGHPLTFDHHTVLAVLGWIVFAALLYKRARHGLRGSQAVAWTVGGFLLIQLGYFGTKLVSESLAVQ